MHYAITLLVLYVGQAAAVNPVSISSSQTRVRELSTKAHHPDSSSEGNRSGELINIRELLEVLIGPDGRRKLALEIRLTRSCSSSAKMTSF
jgi:hypothetical protein